MENILKDIKAFVFDVDGVFTDGGILSDCNGELYRTVDSKDGFGIRMSSSTTSCQKKSCILGMTFRMYR